MTRQAHIRAAWLWLGSTLLLAAARQVSRALLCNCSQPHDGRQVLEVVELPVCRATRPLCRSRQSLPKHREGLAAHGPLIAAACPA